MGEQGRYMYGLIKELFPVCRSITGKGTRETLLRIKRELPYMKIVNVPTGTKVFDWKVPKEWSINDAYIEDEGKKKIIDFKRNNLHLVGYSIPVDQVITLEELQKHLYSLPDQPDWIPYVTSYYKERWGFCLSQKDRDNLRPGNYHVYVDSKLFDGNLTYGELIIPGESDKEIFLSTYVCHPSMANNELSGPVLQLSLAKWLYEFPQRKYTYRLIWIPETIGAITYLSQNLEYMKKHVIAGFNLNCVGDDRAVSYLESRFKNTLADRVAKNVLQFMAPNYKHYDFLHRGSDERQYNAPGVDLPVCSICRSKFHEYPEYHTSADDLSMVSSDGLQGSFEIYTSVIETIEKNRKYKVNCLCEPQLGSRGLYPTESIKGSSVNVKAMMDFLAYADGTIDLVEISNIIHVPVLTLSEIAEKLLNENLILIVEES